VALLATSIWTGVAGGFGLYSRQVGMARAWTALAVAFATVETGKLFPPKPHHPANGHGAAPKPPAVSPAATKN
jgi:hypothetical protein